MIARAFPGGKGRRWALLDKAAEAAMTVSGDDAKNWDAVRRDTMMAVNRGPLIKCDDQTGEVQWQDRDGEQKVTLGPHAVVLVRKGRG